MTKIEWTDKVWNPITGCTPISAGCDNCYAKRFAQRFKDRCGYPADDPFRVTFHPDRLELPLRWRKPSRIFVNSMGDLFHGSVRYSWLTKIFAAMENASWHTFQILTKRPYNYWKPKPKEHLHNVWLGVTVENAKHKDRIDTLLQIPAAVRFVSFEPLLDDVGELDLTGIHWVIVGGETGPRARYMETPWAGSIHYQCQQQGVPFFFKKWGKQQPERPWYEISDTREFPRE